MTTHHYHSTIHRAPSPYKRKPGDENRTEAELLGDGWSAFLSRAQRDTGASPAALGLLQFCSHYMTDQQRTEGRNILAPVIADAWDRRDVDAHSTAMSRMADLDDCDSIVNGRAYFHAPPRWDDGVIMRTVLDLLRDGPMTRRHLVTQMRRRHDADFDYDHPAYLALQDMGVIRVDPSGIVWPDVCPAVLAGLSRNMGEGVR